jgi:capsular exopolysaccharide synthesis family protein
MLRMLNRGKSMLNELISIKNSKSQAAEAYRTLRTNIQFSSFDKKVKTIVVTSSQPSEGKSTIVSNLAITTAQSGKKVLLIDCDLRRPMLHKKLDLSNQEGLTSLLAGEKKLEECVNTIIGLPYFYVLTSGPIPPNPAELLGSNKMKNLFEEFKENFDMIFIDTPPVLAVTDAQVLANLCDGVVFVAAYGEADKNSVVRAKELIDKVGAKILGVIINKIPNEANKYHSYYEDKK